MNHPKYGTEEETTENEFSEMDKSGQEIKNRAPKMNSGFKKDDDDNKKSLRFQKPSMERNVPIAIKYENFFIRTLWTIIMLVFFLAVIMAGHIYCVSTILIINIGIFHEIISLKRNREKDMQVPFFYLINWYFFFVGVFFFYGKLFTSKLTKFVLQNEFAYFLITYQNFIAFLLWILGFLLFVLSLKKGFYRYQFRQFGWSHLAILLIVATCSTISINVYEGVIWFIFPCILVISNDTFAYIFGFFFGKTRLIELSPKKTWEGFIGGLLSTLFVALIGAHYFSKVQYLVCPKEDLTFMPFEFSSCETPAVFLHSEYSLPEFFANFSGIKTIFISSFQLHAMILSMFASLISPFGGFFASGFKRAIKIKDFADIIPGHGGITDRMDCQILMGMFSYLYLHNVILHTITATSLITNYITSLSSNDQKIIYEELKNIMEKKGLLNGTLQENF